MKQFILFNKIALLVFWAAFIWNFIQPIHSSLLPIGILIAAIHVIEYLWKRRPLLDAGEPTSRAFIQTLLFGLFYWRPVLRNANSYNPS